MHVVTDISEAPGRRLKKLFNANANAIPAVDPNTLNSNAPTFRNAMGVSPADGLVSFIHDGASQAIEVYFWHQRLNNLDPTHGWVANGPANSSNQTTVDPRSLATFKIPAGVPYFLSAQTSAINNCWVHDAGYHSMNPNSDFTDG